MIKEYTNWQKVNKLVKVIFTNEVIDTVALDRAMNENAMLLLALIDNVSEIQWQYTYLDQVAGGSGIFTGSRTIEDATAALNATDIKSYGQSADKVQELLDWLDAGTPAGMLSMNLKDSLTIKGNLWDDWHNATLNE